MANLTSAADYSGLALNSWTFLLFAAVAVGVSRCFGSFAARKPTLLAFNLVFLAFFLHSWWQVLVLGLFLLVTFALGCLKQRLPQATSGVWTLFFVLSLWAFLFLVKEPDVLTTGNPFYYMPVTIIGISYLVFRGIAYLMEREQNDDRSLINYLNFMLFFPIIVSGPIERYATFRAGGIDADCDDRAIILPALHRIANGVIKKFVLADNLLPLGIFSMTEADAFAVPLLWLGGMLMLFIVYLDFSGYCDIVIGVARLLGYKVIENFNSPFKSRNVQEFWSRWHISLGNIIQFYLFAPLTKWVITNTSNTVQFPIIVAIYFLSMIVVALWHGLTWGFLAFGALHGFVLVVIQLKRKYARQLPQLPLGRRPALLLGRVSTYSFVSLTLILWFSTLDHALAVYARMFGW